MAQSSSLSSINQGTKKSLNLFCNTKIHPLLCSPNIVRRALLYNSNVQRSRKSVTHSYSKLWEIFMNQIKKLRFIYCKVSQLHWRKLRRWTVASGGRLYDGLLQHSRPPSVWRPLKECLGFTFIKISSMIFLRCNCGHLGLMIFVEVRENWKLHE